MRTIRPFQSEMKPFSKPNVTPFYGILLVLILTFFHPYTFFYFPFFRPAINIMKPQHADLITLNPPYFSIGIDKNGNALVDGYNIGDLEKLPILIEEQSEEQKIIYTKIQLFIDRAVVFERVLEVFRILKKNKF